MEAERAGQFAEALAAFVRVQAGLRLDDVAADPRCRQFAGQLLDHLQAGNGACRAGKGRGGRPPVHDRDWALSVLFDVTLRDPDGMPATQSILVSRLADAFAAAGRPTPGSFWLKACAREFFRRVSAFEAESRNTYRGSPDLQAIFNSESEFLAFRRHQRSLDDRFGRKPQQENDGNQEPEKHEDVIT